MGQEPLVNEQIDAGARFLAEFERCFPVQAAFWLKESEESGWYFYVASDAVKDGDTSAAYAEVLRIAGNMRDPNFGPFDVKVVGTGHPFARGALDLLQRYPGSRSPARIRGRTFGGIGVEEAYVYPSPATVS
jgi:hypothetical protein